MATKKASPSKPKGGPSSVSNHQAFRPMLPCGNKLLQQRWDQTYYDEHRKLVRTAKPMVDTKAPPKRNHVVSKWKKEQTLKERGEIINRDNLNLLDKMQKIMSTRGCVDHINPYVHHSLNQEQRQREQVRVARENLELLKRLEEVEPMYKVSDWIQDWQRKEELANMITSFPNGLPSPRSKSPTRLGTPSSISSPRDKTPPPLTNISHQKTKKGQCMASSPDTTTAKGKQGKGKTKVPSKIKAEGSKASPSSEIDGGPSNVAEQELDPSQGDSLTQRNTNPVNEPNQADNDLPKPENTSTKVDESSRSADDTSTSSRSNSTSSSKSK